MFVFPFLRMCPFPLGADLSFVQDTIRAQRVQDLGCMTQRGYLLNAVKSCPGKANVEASLVKRREAALRQCQAATIRPSWTRIAGTKAHPSPFTSIDERTPRCGMD